MSDSEGGSNTCNTEDWDYDRHGFMLEYINNHFNIAVKKFSSVNDYILRFILITWYMLDYVSLQDPQSLDVLRGCFYNTLDVSNDKIKQYVRFLVDTTLKPPKNSSDYQYQPYNVINHLKLLETYNVALKSFLKTDITNELVVRIYEFKLALKNNELSKYHLKSLFRSLRVVLNEKCF